MKKGALILIIMGVVLLWALNRVAAGGKFNRDIDIQSLPSALRIGQFSQSGYYQWVPVYGDSSMLVNWSKGKNWQETYSLGENIGQVFSSIEMNMLKTVKIEGRPININRIKSIYIKRIDGSDIGYLILFDSPETYCSIFVAFRT